MSIKIFDAAIPLLGAIIFWLLYMKKLSIKKNEDENKVFYKKNRYVILWGAIILSVVSLLILFG